MDNTSSGSLRPVEIIFSCQICYTPISEIYKDVELDKGFRDTHDAFSERTVTKLWLADCCHLMCGKHLEGGGVPLHPSGQVPEAPCPICVAEKRDHDKKKLFGIRGCLEGQYDKQIPGAYFNTPPIRLDSSGQGMEALRFQYLALARFATNAFSRLKTAEASAANLDHKFRTAVSEQTRLQHELDAQATRVKELEKSDQSLQHWKEREPKIMYYLGIFQETMANNEKLRAQLASVGEIPPAKRSEFRIGENGRIPDEPIALGNGPEVIRMQQNSSSSRTLSGPTIQSAPNLQSPTRDMLKPLLGDNSKRPREVGNGPPAEAAKENGRPSSAESRILMPPPPLPSKRPRYEEDNAKDGHRGAISKPSDSRGEGRTMALGAALLEHDQIVMRSDGTWRPFHDEAFPQNGSVPRAVVENTMRSHVPDKDTYSSYADGTHQQFTERATAEDNYPPQQNIHLSPRQTRCSGTQPTRRDKNYDRQPALSVVSRQEAQPATHNASEAYYGHLLNYPGSNIYQQQSQRQGIPFEDAFEHSLNAQPHTHHQANLPPPQDLYDNLEHFVYADSVRERPNSISPSRHAHMNEPYYETGFNNHWPRHQAQTLSPTKASVGNLMSSVASPFFKTNTARRHVGRLTLKDRRATNTISSGLVTTRHHPQQSQSTSQILHRSANEPLTPRSIRDQTPTSFIRRPTGGAAVPASPYFNRRLHERARGPIAPRPNMFARDVVTQMSRRSNVQDRDGFGRSGPTRISLEGRQQSGSLGDYLAAQDGPGHAGLSVAQSSSLGGVRRVARR